MTSTLPPVLSIAGSDSSGGAGIQADLKTMLANGVFGMTAIAALTAQNTTGVTMVTNTPPEMLAAQIDAVFEDIPPVAVKIGMVSSAELITVIADRLTAHNAKNVVLDPVMVATSGAKLIEDDAIAALTSKLFPLATVITPNMPETQVLCDLAVEQGAGAIDYENGESISTENDMVTAGHLLAGHFGCAVLVKGGHGTHDASDVLVEPDGKITWFRSRRINNPNTHGTGCTLSSRHRQPFGSWRGAADGRRPCQAVPDRRFGSAARSWTWFRSDGPRVEVALSQATQTTRTTATVGTVQQVIARKHTRQR